MCATRLATINANMLGSLAKAEVWVAIVLVAVPMALVCGTVIILVLTVERRYRVQAIKALTPLVHALARGRTVDRDGGGARSPARFLRRHVRSPRGCCDGQSPGWG